MTAPALKSPNFNFLADHDPQLLEFAATPRAWLDATAITEFAARVTAEGYAAAESAPLTAARLGEVITITLQPIDAGKEGGQSALPQAKQGTP